MWAVEAPLLLTRVFLFLWMGVPSNALAELRPAWLARGFREAGAAVTKTD